LPTYTTNDSHTTEKVDLTTKDTPPPTSFSSHVELTTETTTGNELEFSQQLFNTYSTVSQQPEIVDFQENVSTVDKAKNTETKEFIQHTTKEEGERVGVEQEQFDDVLQNQQRVNLSPTTEKTSSPTNSLNSTSQQEAFTKKYQPVEVLNSEGEWVSGYNV
jgi:hypothetical protein